MLKHKIYTFLLFACLDLKSALMLDMSRWMMGSGLTTLNADKYKAEKEEETRLLPEMLTVEAIKGGKLCGMELGINRKAGEEPERGRSGERAN